MHILMVSLYCLLGLIGVVAIAVCSAAVYLYFHRDKIPVWEKQFEQWCLRTVNKSFERMNRCEAKHAHPSKFERFADKFGRWFAVPVGLLVLFYAMVWAPSPRLFQDGFGLFVSGWALSIFCRER